MKTMTGKHCFYWLVQQQKKTKEFNWLFCVAISKQIQKQKNSTDHEKLNGVHRTMDNVIRDTRQSLHGQDIIGDDDGDNRWNLHK
jgi:hypothetical protein